MKRSYLFVPGDRPERYAKALAAGADAVIIDLEDAVAPPAKESARDSLRSWLTPENPVLVRINSADTAWFADDIALAGLPGVAGIVLPKAERPDDIARLMQQGAQAVLPLIESALGFHHALDLARQPGVERLLFGSIDFSVDLGLTEGVEELQYFRSHVNAAFAPSADEAAWAARVLQAVENTDGAAVALDGKMVDRPVILQAQAIIEEVRRRH
jgi:citrate lyase subunit beta/citryl-CoA lyase